jgi:peptidoglycan/LPS O-acetylase OafA/YrhL
MNRVFGLDLMRFLAISFVVFGHALYFFPSLGFLANVFVFGVEIFFVLSGFLIGGILIRSFEREFSFNSLKTFWLRRWYRTLPNYYLFLGINFVAFTYLKPGYEWDSKYLFFFQNFLWLPDSFFSVSWSLAVEEWFYLVFPVALFIFYPLTRSLKLSVIYVAVIILICVIASRLYAASVLGWKWNEELRLSVLLRLDSLMFGVLGAYGAYYYPSKFFLYKWKIAILGLCLIVIAIYMGVNLRQLHTAIYAALFFPVACLGFACLLPLFSGWETHNGFLCRGITNISLWSYSLYLLHVPLLEFVHLVIAKYIDIYEFKYSILIVVAWIALSVFSAKVVFEYWEKPTTALRDRRP